ncbi:peptide ABC transporter substrate-binding protein [Paenibacillus illinoisensis]|uniref:peptide ABC transporter substrate-binding protein n=1 Tax=Paenibacillus illinoisensis TaxID=59845 RepID=UPI00203A5092|nr:peptide ABC transporter substrate-binding protein [Paenibacillus illinoisensis]MCM3203137.1 peptide ABC transporter substrate-binding protein [Paenibacillus illinoisensis]
MYFFYVLSLVSLTTSCASAFTNVEGDNSLSGLYIAALEEVISTDSALNRSMEYISIDYGQTLALSDSDGQHILEFLRRKYKVDVYNLTYEQLLKQGLYEGNESNLRGILLRIEKVELADEKNEATLEVSKYRSNEGSISVKITLQYRDNHWMVVDHNTLNES